MIFSFLSREQRMPRSLARAFADRTRNTGTYVKAQTISQSSSLASQLLVPVSRTVLRMCDKYRYHKNWQKFSFLSERHVPIMPHSEVNIFIDATLSSVH